MADGAFQTDALTKGGGKRHLWRTVGWTGVGIGLVAVLIGWLVRWAREIGLQESRKFGDYEVRVYRDEGGVSPLSRLIQRLPDSMQRRFQFPDGVPTAAVEVWHRGKRLWSTNGFLFHLPDSEWGWWERGPTPVHPGMDLNGNGVPDLAIHQWDGGMKSPAVVHVFEAGDRFTPLGTVEGYAPSFEDLDGDGVFEILLNDGLFRFDTVYGMPVGRVILRWTQGGYRVAADLMRRPAPDPETFAALVSEFRDSPEWGETYREGTVPHRLFAEALALMYAGHEDLGWRLIRESWRRGQPADERLLEGFRRQRDQSDYWRELKSGSR